VTGESKDISDRDKLPIEADRKWFTGPTVIFLIALTAGLHLWKPHGTHMAAVLVIALFAVMLYRSVLSLGLTIYRVFRGKDQGSLK
jgi:lipopolysaccharide export LptBFGC system permease protein LptF